MIINLKYLGIDSWSRPVYKDEEGRLWKDTNLNSIQNKKVDKYDLCTSNNNAFDGEPDTPMGYMKYYENTEINLIF